jgi:hypothetical protein
MQTYFVTGQNQSGKTQWMLGNIGCTVDARGNYIHSIDGGAHYQYRVNEFGVMADIFIEHVDGDKSRERLAWLFPAANSPGKERNDFLAAMREIPSKVLFAIMPSRKDVFALTMVDVHDWHVTELYFHGIRPEDASEFLSPGSCYDSRSSRIIESPVSFPPSATRVYYEYPSSIDHVIVIEDGKIPAGCHAGRATGLKKEKFKQHRR